MLESNLTHDAAVARILGIDPGSRVTGYGIIDFTRNRAVHVASGCIPVCGEDLAGKLRVIYEAIIALVERHEPAEMVVEQVFVHRNPESALKLGQARGAAVLAGAMRTLPVYEYAPRAIKQAITGTGSATKEQVQHMIKVLLGLSQSPPTDAADALGVALCHAHVGETLRRRGLTHR